MTTDTTPIDERVGQYVAVRDAIKALEERHAAEKLKLVQLRDYLEIKITKFLAANNLDNIKTAAGTAHFTTRWTASLADPDLFMKFVIDSKQFDLVERRANSTAVKDYVEKNNALPPGCNLNAIQSLGVRRPTGR